MTPRIWIVAACAGIGLLAGLAVWWIEGSVTRRASDLHGKTAISEMVAPEQRLSREQQATILAEAEAAYAHGMEQTRTDPAAASESFALAAAKYQLLADGGAKNCRLYFNLANAQVQSGDAAASIANYLRARSLAPGDPHIAANLAHARQLAGTDSPLLPQDLSTVVVQHIASYSKLLFGAALFTWVVFWGALVAQRFWSGFPWRAVALPAAALAVVCFVGLAVDYRYQDRSTHGVVVGQETIVRAAGGTAFAPRVEKPLTRGTEFDLVSRGTDWLEIRLSDGRSGWIPSSDAEVIETRSL